MLQTIQKIGPLLDLFTVDRPEWGVSEAAEALGVPRSSAHALMTSLGETGLLTTSGRGRYRLGWRIVELYETMRAGTDLRSHAAPVLRALSEQTGETTNLAVLDRGEVLYLDKVGSRQQVGVVGLRVGSRLAPHCSGLGKALLAYATPAALDAVLAHPLRRFTDRTITDAATLRAQLEEVRRTGVAFETGEVVADVACVAAPVRDPYGVVAAAISITAPAYRVASRRDDLIRAVKAAAAEIARRTAQAEGRPPALPPDGPTGGYRPFEGPEPVETRKQPRPAAPRRGLLAGTDHSRGPDRSIPASSHAPPPPDGPTGGYRPFQGPEPVDTRK